jgi:hypothetical protein
VGNDRGGNIDSDPFFVAAAGNDGVVGTVDDNLRVGVGSVCIDATDSRVQIDSIKTDLDERERFVDGDCDGEATADMGAYEFDFARYGDMDGQCDVDFVDFAIFGYDWMKDVSTEVDVDGDGDVDMADLAVLAENWLEGT